MKDGPVEPRYTITHKDGKSIDPTHRFFVLSIDTDPYALSALYDYTSHCQHTHPELAASIREAYNMIPLPPPKVALPQIRYSEAQELRKSFKPYKAQNCTHDMARVEGWYLGYHYICRHCGVWSRTAPSGTY